MLGLHALLEDLFVCWHVARLGARVAVHLQLQQLLFIHVTSEPLAKPNTAVPSSNGGNVPWLGTDRDVVTEGKLQLRASC